MAAVELYVYDLSKGMARQFGAALTGRNIEGIWHTSLVLYGLEIFFGQGIDIAQPGRTHHGAPDRRLDMGRTTMDKQSVLSYIEGLKRRYTAANYHLLDFNCNTFTNELLQVLNGQTIPSYIIDLPSEILATEFGRSMRPMIDQMFSGGRGGPDASAAVEAIEERTFSEHPDLVAKADNCPTIKKLSETFKAAQFNTLPPRAALEKKLNSSFSDLQMLNPDPSIPLAKTTFHNILPTLYALPRRPLSAGVVDSFLSATEDVLPLFPPAELFLFIDLWRLSLSHNASKPPTASYGLVPTTVFPQLVDEFLALGDKNETDRALSMTLLKLFCNALSFDSVATFLLDGEKGRREALIGFMVRGLLSEDRGVKTLAVDLAGGIASLGQGGEEAEIELLSALIEGIRRESSDLKLLYKLGVTLAIVLSRSKLREGLSELLQALEVGDLIREKEALEIVKGEKEMRTLLDELARMSG